MVFTYFPPKLLWVPRLGHLETAQLMILLIVGRESARR